VARQTGTSLEMIEQDYGDARCSSGELDALISDAKRPDPENTRNRRRPSNDVRDEEKSRGRTFSESG
jgi:hypothetical protein